MLNCPFLKGGAGKTRRDREIFPKDLLMCATDVKKQTGSRTRGAVRKVRAYVVAESTGS